MTLTLPCECGIWAEIPLAVSDGRVLCLDCAGRLWDETEPAADGERPEYGGES